MGRIWPDELTQGEVRAGILTQNKGVSSGQMVSTSSHGPAPLTHTHTHSCSWTQSTDMRPVQRQQRHTHTHTHARTHARTHTRTHTHTHTHTHNGLWGLSIGVTHSYKQYVLLPYTYPTPKLSPHRKLCAFLLPPQKTHSV